MSTLWLHVAHTNQSSWAADFIELIGDTDAANVRTAISAGNIALKCCWTGEAVLSNGGDAFPAFGMDNNPRFFIGYALENQCCYTVFVLAEGQRIVSDFIPCEVEVRSAGQRSVFWPGYVAAAAAAEKTKKG